MLALDIETTGLDPESSELVLLALAGEDWVEVLDLRSASDSEIRSILIDCFSQPLVIHNALFDLVFLCRKYDLPFPDDVFDTMLAEQVLTAGLPLSASLEETLPRRLGIRLDKSLQLSFQNGQGLSAEQIAYAENDVRHLIRLAQIQERLLAENQLLRVWRIEREAQPVMWTMAARGIRIDVDGLADLHERYSRELVELTESLSLVLSEHVEWLRLAKYEEQVQRLADWTAQLAAERERLEREWEDRVLGKGVGTEIIPWEDRFSDPTRGKGGEPKGKDRYVREALKKWRSEHPRPPKPKLDISPIDLDSPEQLRSALSSFLGREVADVRAGTLKSLFSELDGERLALLRNLLRWKQVAKVVQAFTSKLPAYLGSDGRLRANFRQIGTATGRPSSSRPNLLQMPNTHEFRRLFVPEPGNLMVVADFSQAELRICAELSQDPNMVRAFREGLDLHRSTASLIFGVPFDSVTDKQRKIAKTINFGILYGMGAGKLRSVLAAEGIPVTEQEAQDLLSRWRRAYSEADKALRSWSEKALSVGWSRTVLGRKRFFDLASQDGQEIWRAAANHVVQGSNADITKIAMRLVHDSVSPLGGTVLLQVYDEILVEVPAGAAERARELVVQAMIRAAEKVLKTVPPGVDAVVSRSWSEQDAVS